LTILQFWCIFIREKVSMDNQTQIISKIKESKNILITVGRNPSIDALTASLGLTLAIDKMKKHSSAIFSGEIPPIMNFLNPEKTFENSTESFQDFIILLDKSKADKLRYKVEGDLVKIFITPYHTTISPTDLKFEQGDLNVDLIIALGVKEQNDIDQAAMAHGKILHSATIITINTKLESSFGAINSKVANMSGYCEAISKLIVELDENLLSKQISTALLTGIVIDTSQFSNERTTPNTMTVASKLLSNGADQQLIVKEIHGVNMENKKSAQKLAEIPKLEEATTQIIGQETLPKPEFEDDRRPIIEEPSETWDDFLPPEAINNEELPPPPDITAQNFSEKITSPQPNYDEPELPRSMETSSVNDIQNDSSPLNNPMTKEPSTEISAVKEPDQIKTAKITDTSKPDPTQFHIPV
jgi:Exopolyphosphatase-related proteins